MGGRTKGVMMIRSLYDYWCENFMDERLAFLDADEKNELFQKWAETTIRDTIADMLFERIERNDDDSPEDGFQKGYNSGYHDAMVEVLDFLCVEHDEAFRD